MNVQSLVTAGFTVSIFLGVLTVGMRVAPGDLRYVLSKPARLARALLAMNVLLPIVVVLICRMFSLHPAIVVALVTLAIAPVGSLFPKAMLPLVTTAHLAYARGVFFASTVLSVILTPIAVAVIRAIFGGKVHVNPLTVAPVVIASVLLPLGIGLAIGRWWPAAGRWIAAIEKVSSLLLLVCAALVLVGTWTVMASLVRQGTLMAIVLIALIGLVIGHVLGGPEEDDRTVLALATVSRHPGVAIAVASLTDQPLAPLGVLLALLVNELAVIPYKRWRRRRAAGAGAAPPAGAH